MAVAKLNAVGDRAMSGAELLDEAEWLIDGGTHPYLAAQMLKVKYANLLKVALRHGRSEMFNRFDTGEWIRYAHDNGHRYGRVA